MPKAKFNVPFLINPGVTHPIMSNRDASFDCVAIASQDDKHVNFGGRLPIGTEYRLGQLH